MTLTHVVTLEPWLAGIVVALFVFAAASMTCYIYSVVRGVRSPPCCPPMEPATYDMVREGEEMAKELLALPVEYAVDFTNKLRKSNPTLYIVVASALQKLKRN